MANEVVQLSYGAEANLSKEAIKPGKILLAINSTQDRAKLFFDKDSNTRIPVADDSWSINPNNIDGVVPVEHGGTGLSALTSGYALIGNGTSPVSLRPIRNNTSTGPLGWTSVNTDTTLITTNTLAYWNGAYSGNSSNITKLGTVSKGTWQATTIKIAYGGTGATSINPYGVVFGNSNSTAYSSTSAGLKDYFLVSNGGFSGPDWKSPTLVRKSLGLGESTGALAVAYGGTGRTSFTYWGLVYADSPTSLNQVAAGSNTIYNNKFQFLRSNGAAAPVWSTVLSLEGGENIPTLADATNINNLTTPGSWKVVDSTHMRTMKGTLPLSNMTTGGRIIVLDGYLDTANSCVHQFIIGAGHGQTWFRMHNGTSWEGWRRFATASATSSVGGPTTPVYVSSDGEIVAGTSYNNATVGKSQKVYNTYSYPTTRSYIEFQNDKSSGNDFISLKYHNALSVSSNMDDSSTGTRWTELWVGNATASGTKGNSQGWLALYGSGANYTQIAVDGTGNNNYFYIPNYSGNGYAVTVSGAKTLGSVTKGVYVSSNGQLAELSYSLNATVNSGFTPRLSFYSGSNLIQDTQNVEYLAYNSAVTGNRTTAGAIRGLRITGTAYGNDAAYLASTTAGDFSLGDPGPQIQFGTAEGTAKAAIIYTNHDSNGQAASSFQFVSDENPVNLVSGGIIAKNYAAIGQRTLNTSYKLYVNGATYLNGNTSLNGDLLFQSGARSIIWSDGTYRQKISIVDDSTANTDVFVFSQSTDSGSTYPALMSIKDTGTIVAQGALELKGHIAGDSGTTGHGLYSGGGYDRRYNNILLHGDPSTASSGIAFVSDYSYSDGVISNMNQPSDCAFIQYHGINITGTTAIGTDPTHGGGESGKLVIGIHNDADDEVWIQTPARTGFKHIVPGAGAQAYVIPDTGNGTGTVGSLTQPVYINAGTISPTSYKLQANINSGTATYLAYYDGANSLSQTAAARIIDNCLNLYPTTSSFRNGMRIHAAESWSHILLQGNTNNSNTSGVATEDWFIGNNNGNFYIVRNGSNTSGTDGTRAELSAIGNQWTLRGYTQAHKAGIYRSGLHIYGPTYGNTAGDMGSGTAGVFRWNDGGPQITFGTTANPADAQSAAIIFTDHDAAATGASFHFVTNQNINNNGGDLTVTAPTFRARTRLTVGQNSDNLSYTLYVNGTGTINGGFGLAQTNGTGVGISLYGGATTGLPTYGLAFATTGNQGKWADVQSDWATYFTMNANNQRGWIWKSTGTAEGSMAASLSSRGVFAARGVGNNNGYIAFPQGGSYHTTTSSVKGALKVVVPRFQTDCMINFDINISTYNESSSNIVTYRIYGYEYGASGWYHPVSKVVSWGKGDKVNLKVRYGYDGTYACITIGEVDTTWAYPQVSITNITHGYSDYTMAALGYGWSISFITTLPSTIAGEITNANTNDINITGNAATATNAVSATTSYMPRGFNTNSQSSAGWGNQTGTGITTWNDTSGGSIEFRKDNPSSGKLSIKVDGRFYGNEGNNPAMLITQDANGYWGMGNPDANATVWVRTTSAGILPYQSGGAGSGHQSLGTSSWYFSSAYIDNVYGNLQGNATSSTKTGNSAIWLYPENNNEINIGGTNNGTTIYVGYRAKDSRPIPQKFVLGGSTGSSRLKFDAMELGSTSYGENLPTTGVEGQIFYQISEEQYELPAGGATGTLLMKASAADRNVTWTPSSIYVSNSVLYGAAWNDYAEYRETTTKIEPGRVVVENGDDTLSLSTKRLQPGGEIVSDTFGFAIGQTERSKTPIAASGRVLAYPTEDRNSYKPGQPVCTGPNGTVSQMTDEEARTYPWLIIGTVSAIPNYEYWGEENIKVNGRIWIRIR